MLAHRAMAPGCSSARSAMQFEARERAPRCAIWSSLGRRAPPIAGSRSVCRSRARRLGLRGKPIHGLQVRIDHMSLSFPVPCRDCLRVGVESSAGPGVHRCPHRVATYSTRIRPLGPSCRQVVELARRAHSLGGRIGVVAEFLCHPAFGSAAVPVRMPARAATWRRWVGSWQCPLYVLDARRLLGAESVG
jgi:hypothetical protein